MPDVTTHFKAERIRSPAYLTRIRTLPCSVRGCPNKIIEAHHVRTAANSGTALKPGDEWTVPLCRSHHAQGHTMGWIWFQSAHKIDLEARAASLWSETKRGKP